MRPGFRWQHWRRPRRETSSKIIWRLSPKITESNILNTSSRRMEGKTPKTETHSPRHRSDGSSQPTNSERCQGMEYIVHVSCAGPEVTGSDVLVSSWALKPSKARNRFRWYHMSWTVLRASSIIFYQARPNVGWTIAIRQSNWAAINGFLARNYAYCWILLFRK